VLSADYCVLDIVLVVDTSSSIREDQPPGVDNLELIKSFLGQLVSPPVDVGQHFDHVAMVTYSASARTQFDLVERTTLVDVQRGINTMPILHGETNIPDGINLGLQVSSRAVSVNNLPRGRGPSLIWWRGPFWWTCRGASTRC